MTACTHFRKAVPTTSLIVKKVDKQSFLWKMLAGAHVHKNYSYSYMVSVGPSVNVLAEEEGFLLDETSIDPPLIRSVLHILQKTNRYVVGDLNMTGRRKGRGN